MLLDRDRMVPDIHLDAGGVLALLVEAIAQASSGRGEHADNEIE